MRKFFFILAFVLSHIAIGQTTGSIYGRVTDVNDDGEPLIFASITLKDTSISGQTNFHGNFEMTEIPVGSYILEVNYLGYEPKEIAINVAAGKVALVETTLKTLSTTTESLLFTEASSQVNAASDKAAKQ